MNARASVAGVSGKASIATAQVKSCGSLPQPSRPDDGRAQIQARAGNLTHIYGQALS